MKKKLEDGHGDLSFQSLEIPQNCPTDWVHLSERLERLNQKLMATIETIPNALNLIQGEEAYLKHLSKDQALPGASMEASWFSSNDFNSRQTQAEGQFSNEYFLGDDL